MKKFLLLNISLYLVAQLAFSQVKYIEHVAGSGLTGITDGPSSLASFNRPVGMAINYKGEIFLTDFYGHVIRKIDLAGNVTTIAGTGSPGYLDGTVDTAEFNNPGGIVADSYGNLFISDNSNNCIRKIDSAGNVYTIAGGSTGFNNGHGSIATFNKPRDITFGPHGFLYVVDRDNNAIRVIDTNYMVTTYAGGGGPGLVNGPSGLARFNNPMCIEFDKAGNGYITDKGNNVIRKIDMNGVVSTLAGSGSYGNVDSTFALSSFNSPTALEIIGDTSLIISDYNSFIFREINLNQGKVMHYAAAGSKGYLEGHADTALIGDVFDMVFNPKNSKLYFNDGSNEMVRCIFDSLIVFVKDTACDQYVSPSGNVTWTASGKYIDLVPGPGGQDTTYAVDLVIIKSPDTLLQEYTCSNYTSPSGKYIFDTTGIYFDTIPNLNACDSLFTIYLTVGEKTNEYITDTSCNYYLSPSTRYIWNKSGTYIDTINNSQGCDSIVEVELTIYTVNTDIEFFNGDLISKTTGVTYQWLDCSNAYAKVPGAVNQSFTPVIPGIYAVEIRNGLCADTSNCINTKFVGINDYILDANIKIYPNPSKGLYNLTMTNDIDPFELQITDISGKSILNVRDCCRQNLQIDLSKYTSGMYFLELTQNNKLSRLKLIKE